MATFRSSADGVEPLASDADSSDSSPKRRRAYLPASERRQLIIKAAQDVFARSNLQGARTRDIAKAAEVNQATLFEHFESKDALFHEAVVLPLLEAMRGMQERVQAYEKARSVDEMRALAQDSVRNHLDSMAEIFPLLTAALFSDLEQGRKLYVEQILPLLHQRTDAMRWLVKDELDPHLITLMHFGIFFMLTMDQLFTGEPQDSDAQARQVTKFAMTGFAKELSEGGEMGGPRNHKKGE